jgi:hypothetical protein
MLEFLMIFRNLLLFCLAVSCTGKETTVRPHETQKETQKEYILSGTEDCVGLLKSKGMEGQLCDMRERELSQTETQWALKQLMSAPFANDAEINSRLFAQRLIWNINSHILKYQDKTLVNQLVDFIISECDAADLKKCRRFSIFAKVNNTREIFIHYLEDKNNKKNLETAFILGAHSSNFAYDDRLLAVLGARNEDLIYDDRVASIVKSALSTNLKDSLKLSLQVYISRNERRLEYLINRDEIEQLILKMHESIGEEATPKQLELLQKNRPAIFKSLQMAGGTKPLLMAVYDLVFAQVISEKGASRVLNKIANEKEIVESFKVYLQNKMLIELDRNDRAVKRTAEEIRLSSIEFLNRFIDNIDPIRLSWNIFKSRAETLSAWIGSASLSLNAKVEMKNYAKGLDATIKTYAEYPHMFYLAYLLSKKNFALIFSSQVENFNIDAADIFVEIINPKKNRHTWLGYSENKFISSQFAIMNSLSYMLSSQSLEVLGVNQEDFLSYMVKNFSKKYLDIPSQKVANIETFFKTTTPVVEFKNFCSKMKKNEKVNLRVQLEDLSSGFLTKAFDENIFEMISLNEVEVSSTGVGYAPFGLKDIPDLHEYANTDIRYVIGIYNVIEKALKKVGQSSSVVAEAIKAARDLQNKARNSFREWMDYGFCMSRIAFEEKKIIQYMIAKEIDYLKSVYANVKSLGLAVGPQEAQTIIDKYKSSYFLESLKATGLKPLDQISSKGYLYSRFDMLGRLAHYLQNYSDRYTFEIILPNQIEKTHLYKYTKSQVNSNWRYFDSALSFEDWVADYYRHQMGTFSGWSKHYKNTVEYTAYITNLVSLLKTSDMISTQHFLDEYKMFMEYFTLGELEKKMLQTLKKESLWDLINLNQYFLSIRYRYTIDAKSQDVVVSKDASKQTTRDRIRVRYISNVYGLYDFPLLYVNQDVLGLDYWVERQRLIESDCEEHCTDYESNKKHRIGPLAEAENFFKTLDDIEMKSLIYPFNKEMVKEKYSELKTNVLLHEKRIDDFVARVRENYEPTQRIDISTMLSITGPVLSQPAINEVTSQKFNFHLQTQNCFKENADCY